MKKIAKKIEGTQENWESGVLGRDLPHVQPVPAKVAQQIDESLGLQMISIRLPKDLIEDFKKIAEFHGIGYQPLMRDVLKQFSESEYKRLALEYAQLKLSK